MKVNKKFIKQKPKTSKKCVACNGTGYYDHTGSPPCSACNGTEKDLNEKV